MSTIFNDIIFIGIDDGNAKYKVSSKELKTAFPTHIARHTGRYVDADMKLNIGESSDAVKSYQSGKTGIKYDVGDVGQPIPRSNTFAYEEPNQILLQHALSLFDDTKSSLSTNRFVVCAGMPLRQFYKQDGSINEANVKNKMTAMASSFDLFPNDENLVKRKRNSIQLLVQPEALAALRTYLFMRDTDGKIVLNPEYLNKTLAVIDPGGKTTDIAVFKNGMIDMERSTTFDVGFNDLDRKAKSYIYDHGFTTPTQQQVKALINNGTIKIRGKEEDHTNWIKQARSALANEIFGNVTDTLSDGFDIDLMIFIGGTIKALKDEIQPMIEEYYGDKNGGNYVPYDIPQNADRLNADGLELFAELWYQQNSAR
ncbi:ParM/StbA family protein [Vibrio sp. RW]|uniref:ParM/StbA family protein n=1 Tax=Vibrio sp. RW TaxID=2998833 RepID=UPI0022CD2DAF|nr:ParM/StbA family protein [Vibrio sp. RW]MDA0146399.1 ParM/StbA family protein [Vibrio sp. RW]